MRPVENDEKAAPVDQRIGRNPDEAFLETHPASGNRAMVGQGRPLSQLWPLDLSPRGFRGRIEKGFVVWV